MLKVQPPTLEEAERLREGTILIGLLTPHKNLDVVLRLRDRRITALALELLPRISRAQAMDALSSQASVAGYRAVLMAAYRLGKFIPMLTTPTGNIRPARFPHRRGGRCRPPGPSPRRAGSAMVEAYMCGGDQGAGCSRWAPSSSRWTSRATPRAATRRS